MYEQHFFDEPKKIKDQHSIILSPREDPKSKLGLIQMLFESLHENEIRYCHWKSNQHLDASMTGDTDLDVLFDVKQKECLEMHLKKLNFKKFIPVKEKLYCQIEDYIGLDYCSGKIVHLHTHFGLTVGELYLKSYQIKIEEKILKSRVYDEEFEIYRIHPAFEYILLFFRQALKIRTRDKLNIYLKKKLAFNSSIVKEYEWLKIRCTQGEIEEKLKAILPDCYQNIYPLLTGNFNRLALIKLADVLKRLYKNDRIYSAMTAQVLRWYREIYIKVFRKYSHLVNQPMVLHRSNPRGGLSIAIIGADGSGKSTVIDHLHSTFKKKLDVYKIYFGRGRGKISWYRKLMVGTKNIVVDMRKNLISTKSLDQKYLSNQSVQDKQNGKNANIFHFLEGLMVAWERSDNLRKMQVAKKKGMLVICDRFPQNQILVFNDGKCLQQLTHSKNPIFRIMARKEARIYKQFEQQTPDIIFKLIANAETVEARKPGETSIETLQQKIEWVKQITFPESSKVVIVNAEESIDKVLFTIKKNIWEAYK